MANVLVVFVPRSGSTIIGDLLAYKYGGVNFDEILQGGIREALKKKLPEDIKKIIKINNIYARRQKTFDGSLSKRQITVMDFEIYQTCFAMIKHCVKKYPVIVKWYPNAFPGKDFIEWAIENKFEIYFVGRRNYEDQVYSYLLARHKRLFYKKITDNSEDLDLAFMNSNNFKQLKFEPSEISLPEALDYLTILHSIQLSWHAITKIYGHYGKIIYYEDYIAKEDFHEIGVDNEMYLNYKKQDWFIRPTAQYEVGKEILNWPDIIKMAKRNFEMPYV